MKKLKRLYKQDLVRGFMAKADKRLADEAFVIIRHGEWEHRKLPHREALGHIVCWGRKQV